MDAVLGFSRAWNFKKLSQRRNKCKPTRLVLTFSLALEGLSLSPLDFIIVSIRDIIFEWRRNS